MARNFPCRPKRLNADRNSGTGCTLADGRGRSGKVEDKIRRSGGGTAFVVRPPQPALSTTVTSTKQLTAKCNCLPSLIRSAQPASVATLLYSNDPNSRATKQLRQRASLTVIITYIIIDYP